MENAVIPGLHLDNAEFIFGAPYPNPAGGDFKLPPFGLTLSTLYLVRHRAERRQENHRRFAAFPADVLQNGDIQVDIEKHTALKNGMPVALTPKEFDVLVFFMRNPDVAITLDQLLSNIWGFDFTGESRSVDIHVQQVRRKMGLQGKLITIPKLGYRLERR